MSSLPLFFFYNKDMRHTPCIYRIDIGKYYYFGQTVQPRKRMNEHLNKLKKERHVNPKMQNVYNKTFDDPRFSILLYCEKDELNYYEQALIDKHFNDKFNMNLNPKADVPPSTKGRKHSEETKKKISESHKGLKKGISLSEEHKKKIGEASKGRKHSEETKKKIGKVWKGRKHSEESKNKISKSRADDTIFSFVHDDGIAIECTVHDLVTTQGLDRSHTWRVVKGKQKQHKGWRLDK